VSWIERHGQLFFHPKTVLAANELTRGDAEKMVGHLGRLWTWAIDHVEDGNLAHLNDRAIAEAAGWRRAPKRFVEALTTAGFLDADRSIHDWDDYAGKLLDRRKADRERKRRDYATKRQVVSHMDSPQESPADIRPHLTRPYRTVPNQVVADTNNGSGRVSVGNSSPTGTSRDAEPRLTERQVIEISGLLLGNEGWPLDLVATRTLLDTLAKENFPDGDLAEAFHYYNDLLENSPLEAKTPRAVGKAIRPWLASWLRRSYLRSLMDEIGRDRASEILTESVLGTDQYSEMSSSDVEYAIELLSAHAEPAVLRGNGSG
jgi:hypothetical protein